MDKLVYPCAKFFFQRSRDEGFVYLEFADNYLPDVGGLLESVYKLYVANAFFGSGSVFSEESLRQVRQQYAQGRGGGADLPQQAKLPAPDAAKQAEISEGTKKQLLDMGFDQNDVTDALALNKNDFEQALNSIVSGKLAEQRMTVGLVSSLQG